MLKNTVILLLVGLAVVTAQPDWRDDMALRDTLATMGSLMGHRWLEKRGLEDYLLRQSWKPDSQGLKCIGRWSYGPSLKVSLRVTPNDTVICLTRGSGASLIRFQSRDSLTLELLGDVNFAGIPRRAVISDTLVIAGIHSGGTGLEIHGISSPASPNLLSRIDLTVVNDIAVDDTLVYVACEDDTLRVFNIADPRSPELIGAYRDSCDLFIAQAGDYCYLVHVSGVNIVDVSDPTAPHRAGHIGGGEPLAVCARDTLCYVTVYQYGLRVYDVSDPSVPIPVGSLAGSDAFDIHLPATCDTVVYTPVLDIISVADPAHPRLMGSAGIPGSWDYGVSATPALNRAFSTNYTDGVVVVDITNPVSPAVETTAFAGGSAVDIHVEGTRAYVACEFSGLSILDASDPNRPYRLGALNLIGEHPSCRSATAQDSFAFMCWWTRPWFQSVDVSDPSRPVLAGGCEILNAPEDMVLRDSFVYVAENRRFQIVNVARPREPELVGSCEDEDYAWDLDLEGDLVGIAHIVSLQLIDVARPDSPCVVGAWSGDVHGVDIVDTIAFVTAPYTGYVSLSVANPTSPYVLDSVYAEKWWNDIVVADTLAFAGGTWVQVLDVSDPRNLRLAGTWTPPYLVRRLHYSAPYLYAACYEAGVCVLETTQVGVAEETPTRCRSTNGVRLRPNPTTGKVELWLGPAGGRQLIVRNVAGREVARIPLRGTARVRQVDFGKLRAGLYFLELRSGNERKIVKFVKQ